MGNRHLTVKEKNSILKELLFWHKTLDAWLYCGYCGKTTYHSKIQGHFICNVCLNIVERN